ncbi:hypothetical protein C8J56DRAFT_774545, partial [Mycena floridula]
LPGIKLTCLTQSIAYKAITEMKTIPDKMVRAQTKKNIAEIKTTISQINGHIPMSKDIWKSIRIEADNRRVQNFMYLMIHGAQRVGAYWKHIPGCETRQTCDNCGVEDSMKHILMECEMPIRKTIWSLVDKILGLKGGEWPELTYEVLMGHGLIKIKSDSKNVDKGRTRLFQIVISESLHQIWKLQCNVVIDEDDIPTQNHIESTWTAAMNMRLEEDRLLTNKYRYKSKALPKRTVLETWGGTLKNENFLPADWIRHPEVLVGIGRQDTLPANENGDDSISISDYG